MIWSNMFPSDKEIIKPKNIKVFVTNETKIISRKEAKLKNLKHYFTGKPCLEGHVDLRYVSSTDCVVCHRLSSRSYGRQNISKIVDNFRIKTYGLSTSEFDNLVDKQNKKCLICEKQFENERNTHLDHCHETGKIRGILCHHCNTGLGLFKDNTELLEKAISYLRKHKDDLEKSTPTKAD